MSTRSIGIALAISLLLAPASSQAAPLRLSGLKIADIKVGHGPKLAQGDLATVLYRGWLDNGNEFDSNMKKDGPPFSFVVGAGSVIDGWDKGVIGMRIGGKRELTIPPSMGYGNVAQGSIPANSTLHFEVMLLDIVKKGEGSYYDRDVLKAGTGRTAKQGDKVTIQYRGTFVNGKEFDSSARNKKPLVFVLGHGDVLKALDRAITGMREGGKIRLRLPPDIAFGARGHGTSVPPNCVVIFVITLVKVAPGR